MAQAYLDDRLPERPDGLRLVPGAGSQQETGAGEVVDVPWEIVEAPTSRVATPV